MPSMTMARIIQLPSALSPIEALARLRGLSHRVLLESPHEGGTSWLAAEPVAVLAGPLGRIRITGGVQPAGRLEVEDDPFSALERLLGLASQGDSAGGCFGFLAYEAGDALERLPRPPADDLGLPDCWFGVYPWSVVWREGACHLHARLLPGMDSAHFAADIERIARRLGAAGAGHAGEDHVEGERPRDLRPAIPRGTPLASRPGVTSSLGEEEFRRGVERIQEYIRAGDLFQANLTHRIERTTGLSGETLFQRLREESPAPYSAYLDIGDAEILSISPESFLSLRGREVTTRPIKGTAPRSSRPEEDRRLADALEGSEKDRAENVMIVDLLRNDLSKVCVDHSVEVPDLLKLESHPTVHHLVSTVRGRLRPDVGPVDLLRATFPGGSITGAPKIRAIEILRELEPVRRGVYTGALGVLTFGGDMELSVAIRTVVLRDGLASYGSGGGITLASDPTAEWEETLDKAAAFFRATDPRPEDSQGPSDKSDAP